MYPGTYLVISNYNTYCSQNNLHVQYDKNFDDDHRPIDTSFARRTLHKTKINTSDQSMRSSDPVQFISSSYGLFWPCKDRS